MCSYAILLIIIVACGFLGGFANYLNDIPSEAQESKVENASNSRDTLLGKSIVYGLCASASVPLFLKILTSELLNKVGTKEFQDINYFVFAGYCVIAAVFSRRFMEDLYSKVARVNEQVAKVAEKAEEAAEQAKEAKGMAKQADINARNLGEMTEEEVVDDEVIEDVNRKSVIEALLFSRFKRRTLTGIVKDSKLERSEVEKILRELRNEGIVVSRKGKKGTDVWRYVDSKIKVIEATYGVDDNFKNVTEIVNNFIADNILEIVAINEHFGDPVPGVVKKLRIKYETKDGETITDTVTEGETFKFR